MLVFGELYSLLVCIPDSAIGYICKYSQYDRSLCKYTASVNLHAELYILQQKQALQDSTQQQKQKSMIELAVRRTSLSHITFFLFFISFSIFTSFPVIFIARVTITVADKYETLRVHLMRFITLVSMA